MNIHLNGQLYQAEADCTLSALIASLALRRDGIAVAINGEVIPRVNHSQCRLQENDRVEIIQAVGGG